MREVFVFEREVRHKWVLKADAPWPGCPGGERLAVLGAIWREPDGTWEGFAPSGRGVWGRNGFDAAVWITRCARKYLQGDRRYAPDTVPEESHHSHKTE